MTAIKLNLRNNAVTQYSNHQFNSLCTFRGRVLGAEAGGIYELGIGSQDAGVDISAWFELPTSTFGIDYIKKMRRFYLRGEMDGSLELVTVTHGGRDSERVYPVVPRNKYNLQQTVEIPAERSQTGEHWTLTVRNVDGADFSVDAVDGVAIPLTRRRGV